MKRRGLDSLYYEITDVVERIESEDVLQKEKLKIEEANEDLVLDALDNNHTTFVSIQKFTKLNPDDLSDAIARLDKSFGLRSRKIKGGEGEDREYFLVKI